MYEIKLNATSETTTFRFYSKQTAENILRKWNGQKPTQKNVVRPVMIAA